MHTVLISDVEAKARGSRARFWYARDVERQRELLREYEMHAPGRLRRVAFTTEFEWERNEEGRWFTTEEVVAEAMEEPANLKKHGVIRRKRL